MPRVQIKNDKEILYGTKFLIDGKELNRVMRMRLDNHKGTETAWRFL